MVSEKEYFQQTIHELSELRRSSSNERTFRERYHDSIERLFQVPSFRKDRQYAYYERQYLQFWADKLKPYRLAAVGRKTLEEIRVGHELIDQFFQVLDLYPELKSHLGTNKLCFLRSNRYALEAIICSREESDDGRVLELWHRAGESCSPGTRKFHQTEDDELLAQREQAFSQECKLRAFRAIGSQSIDYSHVISQLKCAHDHASNARDFYQGSGNLEQQRLVDEHIAYFNYWISVFTERQALLDKKFDDAQVALAEAITTAKKLDPNEDRIFPNRFQGIKDLTNEVHLVCACNALFRAELRESRDHLQAWLDDSSSIRGTWRYLNLDVRKRALECLIALYIDNDKDAYQRLLKSLRERILSRPQLGEHTRSIIKILEREFATREGVCGELYSVFPIDAYAPAIYEDKLWEPTKEVKLRQLPPFYRDWLDLDRLERSGGFVSIDYSLLLYVRVVLEYCTYYAKRLSSQGRSAPRELAVPVLQFCDLSWKEIPYLVERIGELLVGTNKQESFQIFSEKLKAYLSVATKVRAVILQDDALRETLQDVDLRELSAEALDILAETNSLLFPHPIRIQEGSERPTGEEITYTVERIWDKQEKQMYLVLPANTRKLTAGRFYFLPSRWKRRDYDYLEYRPVDPDQFSQLIWESDSFGIPRPGCVLLYEGETEELALPILLDHYLPEWGALKIRLIKGGGSTTVETYRAFRQEQRCVIILADKDVVVRSKWRDIVADRKNTFLMDPDFEGSVPQYLTQAARTLYPELLLDPDELSRVNAARIARLGWKSWGGTIEGGLKEHVTRLLNPLDRPKYVFDKKTLAPMIAALMVKQGLAPPIEAAFQRVIELAEGRGNY